MNDDLYFEAQQAPDVLDQATGVGRTFDTKLAQADTARRQQAVDRMHAQPAVSAPAIAAEPVTVASPAPPASAVTAVAQADPQVTFNPYPTQIHQTVIQPLSSQSKTQAAPQSPVPDPVNTSEKQVSPDIISLASNPDLSIETIAHEAERIKKREAELGDDEVVISLR